PVEKAWCNEPRNFAGDIVCFAAGLCGIGYRSIVAPAARAKRSGQRFLGVAGTCAARTWRNYPGTTATRLIGYCSPRRLPSRCTCDGRPLPAHYTELVQVV